MPLTEMSQVAVQLEELGSFSTVRELDLMSPPANAFPDKRSPSSMNTRFSTIYLLAVGFEKSLILVATLCAIAEVINTPNEGGDARGGRSNETCEAS